MPILDHRDEIIAMMKKHQVIIVCGDTGSGKTTQLPQIALALGFGSKGKKIACTQPRRLATVTVAERVASEMKSEVGKIVGYQHRYAKVVSEETRIKFMTDGVLLAETRRDSLLQSYDTIIVDEAHERSLNIDFLLGILKRILIKRRDLKVIVSSATLDTEKFSAFFNNAPTIIVPGRLFEIDVLYSPPRDGEETDLPRDVARALSLIPSDDDTLVFLPGERDIRETADYLQRSMYFRNDDILPLLASLPASEQKRAFSLSSKRRIILATNVAETSLTIPGIKAVIDSGLARISRYIHRTQIQRLQIENISQASARQRAGRCGRIGPGTCIRLYSEEDFNSREQFTAPEILRSSLAGVILTMLDLRLGEIEKFPFIDAPKPTMIREGIRELIELGAICHNEKGQIALTNSGRDLAMLPIDPRLAKIIMTASRLATLPSVLPIVALMSCDNPMRRPVDEKEKADQAHAQFRVEGSDFLGTLKLWKWWEKESENHSQSQLRQIATKNYLSFPKMREWRELVRQLTEISKRLKLDIVNDNGGSDALHRSLISGLLSRLGTLDTETYEYRGAHGLKFVLHPGSSLSKKSKKKGFPSWVVAGELVDTSRLYARNVATIDPRWIEELAGNLCRHHYSDPEWDEVNGFVRAKEQVTLYGLTIVHSRRRDLSRIDPVTARRYFLLYALCFGLFPKPIPPIVKELIAFIKELREYQDCLRREAIYDTDKMINQLDLMLPKEIVCASDLRKYLARAKKEEINRLHLRREDWFKDLNLSCDDFPKEIRIGNAELNLSYCYMPDDLEMDGVTCIVRKKDAAALRLLGHDWLVPGLLSEKVSFLLNALPNGIRRTLGNIQDIISIILPILKPGDKSLIETLIDVIYSRFGVRLPSDVWDSLRLPPHLRMSFSILSDDGKEELICTKNLDEALKIACVDGKDCATIFYEEGKKYTSWSFGELEECILTSSAGWGSYAYPALVDEGDGVSVRLFKNAGQAIYNHARGVARLMYLELFKGMKKNDYLFVACREVGVLNKTAIRNAEAFRERLSNERRAIKDFSSCFESMMNEVKKDFDKILLDASELPSDIYDDIETQVAWLTPDNYVTLIPYEKLQQYRRFIKGIKIRILRAKVNPASDRSKMKRVLPYWETYEEAVLSKKVKSHRELSEFRWMIEEYRISLFAQGTGILYSVSQNRLNSLWQIISS